MQVCAEAGGGVVSTRDFVNLRHWALVDGVYISAGGSVNHPAMPPQVNLSSSLTFYTYLFSVKAGARWKWSGMLGDETSGGSTWPMPIPVAAWHRHQGGLSTISCTYSDPPSLFQGWIPQSIIDKALSGTQFEYIANIRARARVLRAGQLLDSTVASCSDMAEGAPPTPWLSSPGLDHIGIFLLDLNLESLFPVLSQWISKCIVLTKIRTNWNLCETCLVVTEGVYTFSGWKYICEAWSLISVVCNFERDQNINIVDSALLVLWSSCGCWAIHILNWAN